MENNSSEPMDVDVSIHIANAQPRSDIGAETPSKRPATAERDTAKARKRARSKTTSKVTEAAAPDASDVAKERPDHKASFRHLFSFAEKSGAASASDKDVKTSSQKSRQFALFDDGQSKGSTGQFSFFGEEKATGREVESEKPMKVSKEGSPDIGLREEGREALRNQSAGAIGGSKQNKDPFGRTGLGNHREEKHVSRSLRKSASVPFRESRDTPQKSSIAAIIPDDIDTSPEAVLALAKQFCRTKSIEQLEKEWCEEDGIRDQMKRDFKLKRNRRLKDRNLRGAFKA